MKKYLLYLSGLLYALSLVLPFLWDGEWAVPGWVILLGGGFSMLFTGAGFFWFANPLFLFAIFYAAMEKYKKSLLLSAAAFLFSLEMFVELYGLLDGWTPFISTESLRIGYFLWISSMLVLIVYTSTSLYRSKRSK